MNFKKMSDEEKDQFGDLMFEPLSSPDELKNWIMLFLGLEYPNTKCDLESNSNPTDAIWQVYQSYKTNTGALPGAIWLSARECLKTISVAVLEILLLLHFKLEIAHASATESQSQVCLKYIQSFFYKIEPLLEAKGWQNTTQNKRTFEFNTPDGDKPFIKVVICTAKGMNSLHANLLVVDELDLADPSALNEGKNIVGFSRGFHAFTLFLSTRKYAFGPMSNAIENADEMGYKIFRWNIMDVTSKCTKERYMPEKPKEDRYVAKSLPLRQLSKEEFDLLPDMDKLKWDLVEGAHAGCKTCILLPVCRKRLSELPQTSLGGFYKPIKAIIQKFKENSPEIAEAQLLCWKPGSEGLVYPRFNSAIDIGNIISIKKAYETLMGPTKKTNISEITLLHEMQKLSIEFYAGIDWGYDHDWVLCIVAVIPNGEYWLMETYASPGLELDDQLQIGISFRDKYNPQKWFADTNMPSSRKTFTKNGMRCIKFDKDVLGGIEAVRSKISNAAGKRMFKVIHNDSNKKAVTAIMKHRFKLDGQGNVTQTPDDERGIADICDTLRYIGQNLFPVRGFQKPSTVWMDSKGVPIDPDSPEAKEMARVKSQHENQMLGEIQNRIAPGEPVVVTSKKGSFHFTV